MSRRVLLCIRGELNVLGTEVVMTLLDRRGGDTGVQ